MHKKSKNNGVRSINIERCTQAKKFLEIFEKSDWERGGFYVRLGLVNWESEHVRGHQWVRPFVDGEKKIERWITFMGKKRTRCNTDTNCWERRRKWESDWEGGWNTFEVEWAAGILASIIDLRLARELRSANASFLAERLSWAFSRAPFFSLVYSSFFSYSSSILFSRSWRRWRHSVIWLNTFVSLHHEFIWMYSASSIFSRSTETSHFYTPCIIRALCFEYWDIWECPFRK